MKIKLNFKQFAKYYFERTQGVYSALLVGSPYSAVSALSTKRMLAIRYYGSLKPHKLFSEENVLLFFLFLHQLEKNGDL